MHELVGSDVSKGDSLSMAWIEAYVSRVMYTEVVVACWGRVEMWLGA